MEHVVGDRLLVVEDLDGQRNAARGDPARFQQLLPLAGRARGHRGIYRALQVCVVRIDVRHLAVDGRVRVADGGHELPP